ncbi:putative gamma-glutamylcyclotransferase-like isoform X1 [Leptotrombidium deliense]|uniref:Gamma-glutamylcyclotransferase family protein n=1 Tax=Leptotrombidium deliense TaxID=299467 RepID=A0A443S536_9ACAR|nr:putative gamma-glutamylcyclotransferase-like isoform X1 [Leptotrombidium deliense]
MKLSLLFVYGTLKRNQPNYRLLMDKESGETTFVSNARTVQKWPLIIASKYNIPYLLNKRGFGNQIFGELYYVNERKLNFLDEFEKCPQYYDRLQIPVYQMNENENTCNTTLNPWVYILSDFKESLLEHKMYESYDSRGSHGLRYVKREDQHENYSTICDVKYT